MVVTTANTNTRRAQERMERLVKKPLPPMDSSTRVLIIEALGQKRFDDIARNGLHTSEVMSVRGHGQLIDDITAVLGPERLTALRAERLDKLQSEPSQRSSVTLESLMTDAEREKMQEYIKSEGTSRPHTVVNFRGVNVTDTAYIERPDRATPRLGK